jgi:hypothetical protein
MFDIQSFSDIITNSSSEIFVIKCNNKDVLNEIKQIVDDIVDAARLPKYETLESYFADFDYENHDWDYSYKKGDLIIESCSDNTIPGWLMDFIESCQWKYCDDDVSVDRTHLG